jgi:small GTP-binding protein
VVLVYDMTDPVSFNNVSYWLKKIKKHGDENVEIMLLGNKVDLFNEIQVSSDDAEILAKNNDIVNFETSAKDATNVDRAFKTLLTNIMNNEKLYDKIKIEA